MEHSDMASSAIDKAALLERLADGVAVCSRTGSILYANGALAGILGLSQDEIPSGDLSKLADRKLDWDALVSLLEQGGVVQDYEMRFKRADGVPICAALSGALLETDSGERSSVAIVFRDISTRKGVENELRDKAFRIDITNKVARLMSVERDLREQALASVAQELRKLFNFDVMMVGLWPEKGRHVEVLWPYAGEHRERRPSQKVPEEGSIVEQLRFGRNAVVVGKDAGRRQYSELTLMEPRQVSSLLAVPLTSRGRIFGSLNIAHSRPDEYNLESADVLRGVADQIAGLLDNMLLVERLQARIDLQESLVRTGVELQKAIDAKEIYASIASNLRDVVDYSELSFYLVDWQKRSVHPVYAAGPWVDEVMAASGTLDEGVVGTVAKSGIAELIDDIDSDPRVSDVPGTPNEHNSMLALPLTGPEGVMGVLELYRPSGKVFSVADLEAGKMFALQAAVALFNSQLLARLQEAKKEIELLNDLMFHDINNFNFATLNYVQMVAGLPQVPDEHKVYLEKSLHLIRQTADLIESVKKLTKIGVMDPNDFVTVDLVPVLRKIASGLEAGFPGKPVSVTMNLPESAPAHANKLVDELFINLLSNSVKYDPHDAVEIDLACEKAVAEGRTFWKVSVADRGNGVPDEKKGKLFQKYVRLKPDSEISGSGLGLSLCRALTDKFGGRIWVEDRVQGRSELGAKFMVLLPVAKDRRA